MRFAKTIKRLTYLAVAMLAAGCGNSGNSGTGGAAGALAAAGGAGGSSARYVISTGVPSGNDFLGYLATVPSLDATTTFTLDKAIEIEPSWIFAQAGQPYVYAASIFGPTIDRYRVGDDGSLTKDKTVSFANLGVQSPYLAALAPIYSDTKSYFVDDSQDQMVIWNPKEMTVIGTIPFNDAMDGALPPQPEGTVIVHDGLIMTAIDWSDSSTDSSLYGTRVRLVGIDPATDTIVQSTTDTRITYASPLGVASDQTVYFSPPSLIAAYALIASGHGSPSHAVRLAPASKEFDATYDLDLSALVGGRPAGALTLLDDQTAIIRAWHADLVDPVTPANWQDVLWTQAGFLWWRWHVGDAQAVQIPNQSPGTLDATVLKIDGKTYVVRTNADSTTTTLDQIDAQGNFHAGLSGPGQFIGNGVIRIR